MLLFVLMFVCILCLIASLSIRMDFNEFVFGIGISLDGVLFVNYLSFIQNYCSASGIYSTEAACA